MPILSNTCEASKEVTSPNAGLDTQQGITFKASDAHERCKAAFAALINSMTKHVGYTEWWQLTKSATNQLPKNLHEVVLDTLAEFRVRNSKKPLSRRQAKAEIDAHYRSTTCNADIKRFFRLIIELGGTITLENRVAIESATFGGASTTPFKKLSLKEKFQKAIDDYYDASERICDFMNGKMTGSTINRNTELSSIRGRRTSFKDNPYFVKKGLADLCDDLGDALGDVFVEGVDKLYIHYCNEKGFPISTEEIAENSKVIAVMRNALYLKFESGWQTIDKDGKKRFMGGQPTIGQFVEIGVWHDARNVIVCEGVATGITIHLATGLPVVCALSLHNILPVAASLLHCETDNRVGGVLIAADTGHPEKMKEFVSILRSEEHRANWVEPIIGDIHADNIDFNDYFISDGLEAVNNSIQAAIDSLDAPLDEPVVNADFIKQAREIMKNNQPPKALIKGVIYEKSLSSITGPTMAGKSFVAILIAFCIASGIVFHGRKTRQAGVLYIAGEGSYGLRARFKALLIEYGLLEMTENLFVTAGPIDLLNPGEVEMIANFIKKYQIELVIIDTFARCFAADENSAKDMGAAIQAITKELIGAGAAVLLVHHTGHGDQSRARGSSSFRAVLDTEIGVEKAEGGLRLKCWKSKDFEPWPDETFKFKVIDTLDLDEDLQPITSLVLEPGRVGSSLKLSLKEGRVWDAIKKLGSSFNLDDAKNVAYPLIDATNKRQALRRLLDKLTNESVIIFLNERYVIAAG